MYLFVVDLPYFAQLFGGWRGRYCFIRRQDSFFISVYSSVAGDPADTKGDVYLQDTFFDEAEMSAVRKRSMLLR